MAGHRNFSELRAELDKRPGAAERREHAHEVLDAEQRSYADVRRAARRMLKLRPRYQELEGDEVRRWLRRETDLLTEHLWRQVERWKAP